ncbi:MAG: TonB family protein [Vicinamibacterales bacterium]
MPDQFKLPDQQTALQVPSSQQPPAPRNGALGRSQTNGGSLGDALRNLQRYVQRDQFDNAQGGGAFGPAIQFDTKGVEFGPWIRRFVAQVKRNWLIPYAAMSMKGHVVVTFNVHKDGTITDITVVGASPVAAFNNAAFGALSSSDPTAPPPEYPRKPRSSRSPSSTTKSRSEDGVRADTSRRYRPHVRVHRASRVCRSPCLSQPCSLFLARRRLARALALALAER